MRQNGIWLASVAAIMPLAATATSIEAVQASQSPVFSPPSEPMVLTRKLRRLLPGGAEVLTMRSYEIQIRPIRGGYIIDGTLLDSAIDVPPGYEALAMVERNRPDDTMFPMKLDSAGQFIPQITPRASGTPTPAGKKALAQLAALGLSESEAADAHSFISQVTQNPSRTAWPQDLFNPQPGKRSDTQTIPLPGGKTGQVVITIDASRSKGAGILGSLNRQVTTRLGGTDRVTHETWVLTQDR